MNRFKVQLQRQIDFLRRSCRDYDAGEVAEGARIATCIRILLHDTGSQTSLLSHMNALAVKLKDSVGPKKVEPTTILWEGMCSLGADGLRPSLGGKDPWARFIPASEWWAQVVSVFDHHAFTRREVVTTAANKDGGAHVDRSVPDRYEALTRGVFEVYVGEEGREPVQSGIVAEHQFMMLRQMGHELLTSPELMALAE